MTSGNLEEPGAAKLAAGSTRSRHINYRYPLERWVLLATLLIIGLALLYFRAISLGGLALFFILGTVVNYLLIRAYIAGFKRDSVQVSETQFPEINALVGECRRYVKIPADTRVFISYSPYMNAFAIGLGRPYSIVLFSALIDHADEDELKYIISHEMGHISFGHTVWLTLIGQLGSQTYGLPLLGALYRFCFLLWSRTAELTADRAGLVGCGRLDKAISAQLKIGAGPWLAERVDIKTLARQAHETQGNFFAAFREAWGTHPLMTTRIQRLANFAASDAFRLLRPDAVFTTTPEADRASSNGTAWNGTPSQDRKIRRLTPGSNVPSGPPNGPADLAPSPVSQNASPDPALPGEARPGDWTTEIGFQRLHTAAVRANTEQADMWLKLGELMQTYGEGQQAAICLQQAKTLIVNPTRSAVISGQVLAQLEDLALGLEQKHYGRLKTRDGSTCPTCEALNPVGAHFCHQCQTQLEKPCLACDTWLLAHYQNCPHCGQKQDQLIAELKNEAELVRKTAERPLPPRRLTRLELIYGAIFMLDVVLVLSTLAWRVSATDSIQSISLLVGAFSVPIIGIVIGIIWARRRRRHYWRTFDRVDATIRRYNDIATTLARHNISLDPPRIALNDPWR